MAKQNFYGDGVVRGKMIHKTQDARITYANTPVFDLETIPANRNVHIGGGVFAQSCTDEMADRACLAFYAYLRGNERPLTRRDLGIQRQAWKYALKEALKGD